MRLPSKKFTAAVEGMLTLALSLSLTDLWTGSQGPSSFCALKFRPLYLSEVPAESHGQGRGQYPLCAQWQEEA